MNLQGSTGCGVPASVGLVVFEPEASKSSNLNSVYYSQCLGHRIEGGINNRLGFLLSNSIAHPDQCFSQLVLIHGTDSIYLVRGFFLSPVNVVFLDVTCNHTCDKVLICLGDSLKANAHPTGGQITF